VESRRRNGTECESGIQSYVVVLLPATERSLLSASRILSKSIRE
jgi:hypothetical protein